MFYVMLGPSYGKEGLKKQLNLNIYILSLMKSEKWWENVIGQKSYELRVVNWGKYQGLFI